MIIELHKCHLIEYSHQHTTTVFHKCCYTTFDNFSGEGKKKKNAPPALKGKVLKKLINMI